MQASTGRFIPWRVEKRPVYALIVLRDVRDGDTVELEGDTIFQAYFHLRRVVCTAQRRSRVCLKS